MSWLDLPTETPFGLANLPYGVFDIGDGCRRVGVAVGDAVLDAGAAASVIGAPFAELLGGPVLDPLLAAGRSVWQRVREAIAEWLTDYGFAERVRPHLYSRADVALHLPFTVGDYVDFYASEHHATNTRRIFRPDSKPLTPNWEHMPIGYHGRSSSVVVSGTPVVRPLGQRSDVNGSTPVFAPSERLDFEAEVGFVVGVGSPLGSSISVTDFAEHVFGVFLLNDWSARDIQEWESVPLGPFLGKSFATSISPWVVPLDALESARVRQLPRSSDPLPYLCGDEGWLLDLAIEVRLNGHIVSEPRFSSMYWTPAQMLAHMTVNGAPTRTGDIYASGTVSGADREQRGSLLELSWGGDDPLTLPDGNTRTYLEDHDTVTITATAPGPDGTRIGFGEVTGTINPRRGRSW